jgi:hypothetical protein
MTKLLIALGGASLAALATALTLALGGNGGSTPTFATQTTPTADISGPCDEVEHANDPRCTGGTATTPARADDRREPGEDVRGPCDEADEDRVEDEDHSGPGHGSDDEDHDDDRSGSNSGRG